MNTVVVHLNYGDLETETVNIYCQTNLQPVEEFGDMYLPIVSLKFLSVSLETNLRPPRCPNMVILGVSSTNWFGKLAKTASPSEPETHRTITTEILISSNSQSVSASALLPASTAHLALRTPRPRERWKVTVLSRTMGESPVKLKEVSSDTIKKNHSLENLIVW